MLRTRLALAIAALWIVPATARALSITVAAPATVDAGAFVDVELHVLGAPELGDFAPPSVRAFDLDLTFDASLLAYAGVSFGPFLGSPGSESIVTASELSGVVDLKEVSLLSGSALDALQPRDFLLATLTFQALGAGDAQLELTQRDLADVAGSPLAVTGPSAANVAIVPEPATAVLLAGGLLVLAERRRTRRRPSRTEIRAQA